MYNADTKLKIINKFDKKVFIIFKYKFFDV